VELPGPKRSKQ